MGDHSEELLRRIVIDPRRAMLNVRLDHQPKNVDLSHRVLGSKGLA